ncbi:MAG: hypothetical protein IPO06_15875 [Leptospiraceae bacterium]|nr:hypothetical protein [Leptospiraceae bacterium]
MRFFQNKFTAVSFNYTEDSDEKKLKAERLTLDFIESIPETRRLLFTDVKAMYDDADPAAENLEIIFCYPRFVL